MAAMLWPKGSLADAGDGSRHNQQRRWLSSQSYRDSAENLKRKNHLKTHSRTQRGFSFLELVAATAIFIVLAGIIFSVLVQGQQSYETESGVMDSFQQASIAVDQIVRDVHTAGYPPANAYTTATAAAFPN